MWVIWLTVLIGGVALIVVGFATAFELVVLCWSAARRGATDVALAGVVGSFAYNMTISLGAGALLMLR